MHRGLNSELAKGGGDTDVSLSDVYSAAERAGMSDLELGEFIRLESASRLVSRLPDIAGVIGLTRENISRLNELKERLSGAVRETSN